MIIKPGAIVGAMGICLTKTPADLPYTPYAPPDRRAVRRGNCHLTYLLAELLYGC